MFFAHWHAPHLKKKSNFEAYSSYFESTPLVTTKEWTCSSRGKVKSHSKLQRGEIGAFGERKTAKASMCFIM